MPAMISYAQNFEDVMLCRVFRNQPTGFYIDVGAADPVHHSVTKWFYDLGWTGVNIEPYARFFESLQRDRTRDVNLNCGAGAVSGEASFFEMSLTHEWSSFDDAAGAEAVARGEAMVEHPVPILTLNEIIERHGGGRTIDFIKIDVEGWEKQVLNGLDLSRHRPTVIVIEATHQGRSEPNYANWEQILTDGAYCPIYFDGLNKFYIAREKIELARHFAVPPNVFDDYTLHENQKLRAQGEAWLKQIDTLTAMVKNSQSEGEARLKQIDTLTAIVKDSQAESDALLQETHSLTALLENSVAEAATRLEQLNKLRADIAALQIAEAPRSLKMVLPLAQIFRKVSTVFVRLASLVGGT